MCKSKGLSNEAVGVLPFIVLPFLQAGKSAYVNQISALWRFSGKSMKKIFSATFVLRRDYGVDADGASIFLDLLPDVPPCESIQYPNVNAFSENMVTWASLYLQSPYDNMTPAHELRRPSWSNNHESIRAHLITWTAQLEEK